MSPPRPAGGYKVNGWALAPSQHHRCRLYSWVSQGWDGSTVCVWWSLHPPPGIRQTLINWEECKQTQDSSGGWMVEGGGGCGMKKGKGERGKVTQTPFLLLLLHLLLVNPTPPSSGDDSGVFQKKAAQKQRRPRDMHGLQMDVICQWSVVRGVTFKNIHKVCMSSSCEHKNSETL